MYAYYVNERLKEHKYACSTTSTKAPSKQAKKEKINQYSGDVKQNFIFLAPKYQDKQYQKAMDELTTFVYIGDNEHDDAGVLFDCAGFAKVGHDRALVGSLFKRAVELREHDDRQCSSFASA